MHDYILDGTNIVKEIVTDVYNCPRYVNEYLYDLDGTVCGLKHNGTAYYFYKNLQGDIIAITDDTGATVARYTYDVWGKCTIVSDSSGVGIATINPFRYRSYYYDAEIGMYYLQSRYYDPAVGRFINADAKVPSENDGKQYSNLFSYACNNPINEDDVSGYIAAFLAKKIGSVVVNAVIGVLAQVLGDVIMSALRRKWSFSSLGTYISAVLKGAWDGLWGGGIAKEICKSMLSNILSQLIDWIHKKKGFDFVSLLSSVLDGIFTYVIGKIVKVPKYIREIKKSAMEHGIKGTKKLMKYLNKVIWQRLSITLTLSGIANFVNQFVSEVINYAIQCAKEVYNNLKKDIGGLVVV